MVSFICDNCNKQFTTKQSMNRHIDNNTCKNKDFECKYCNKYYSSASTMYRHIRTTCKIKKNMDNEKSRIYKKLLEVEKNNKVLLEKINKMEKQLKQQPVKITNINNGTINTNNNIVLIGYGREDMTKIDKKDILKSMKKGFYSTIQLTDTVHFNPKYPEYHNIYISNIKDKYAMMYDGKNWTLTTKTELIDRLYDDKKYFIEDNLEDFCKSITGSQKRALERWINIDEEHDKIKEVKERIKLLLYNKRDIPLSTNNGELEQLE